MNSIIGLRNKFLWLGYQAVRPLIFLMEPEQAHYSLKRVGVFLGKFWITRKITSLLMDYEHPSLNTNVPKMHWKLYKKFGKNA